MWRANPAVAVPSPSRRGSGGDTIPRIGSTPGHRTRLPGRRPPRGATPLRILVAEDSEFNSRHIERLLTRRGNLVRVVADGRVALDLAGEEVVRPVAPGHPHAGARRPPGRSGDPGAGAGGRGTSAGHRLDGERAEGGSRSILAAGMDEFLPKPVRNAELLTTIDRVVASHGDPRPAPADAGHHPDLLDPVVLMAACGDDEAMSSASCARTSEPMPLPGWPRSAKPLRPGTRRGCGRRPIGSAGCCRHSPPRPGTRRRSWKTSPPAAASTGARPLVDRLEAMVHELGRRVDELSIDRLRELTERAEGR